MHIFRFFEEQDFIVNKIFVLSQQNSHKIISVLRLQINSKIYLFNNTNIEFTAQIINIKTIKNIKSKIVEIKILQAINKNLESPLKIHLAQAVAKNDNMDWVVQKAVELGVHKITPIITNRTIVKIAADKTKKSLLHWQSIAISACCQCERNVVPIVNDIISFNDFINTSQQNIDPCNKFILSPSIDFDNNYINKDININPQQEIILVIGPEGGFNLEELKLAKQNQFLPLTFGPRILRTETASIVALSILQSKYGDL